MKKRNRDYQAEYRRRVERALARGASRSQARGHPRKGEKPLSKMKSSANANPKLDNSRADAAYRSMRQGKSLTQAAKEIGVTRERLSKHLISQRLIRKRKNRWILSGRNQPPMLIYSDAKAFYIRVNAKNARLIGQYLNAVKNFLKSGDQKHLDNFLGKSVLDKSRVRHVFETRPNVLFRLHLSGSARFEDIYQFSI